MKMYNRLMIALVGVLVASAPFMTKVAEACASGFYEIEIPDCLK